MSDTLRKLQDRREIEDLLFEYCDLVDAYECDEIARLFTEDCLYDFGPALGGERRGNERLARGAPAAVGIAAVIVVTSISLTSSLP